MDYLNFLSLHPELMLPIIFLLGLVVGSFLNVVICRLPVMLERKWHLECQALAEPDLALDAQAKDAQPMYNLMLPRSHCPKCKKNIPIYHNIPLISWLVLRGRCAFCQAPISIQYPAVELVTALMSVAIFAYFGATYQGCAALVLTWSLIALSVIDFKTFLLPDDITMPLMWLGILLGIYGVFTDLESSVIGAMAGYLFFWGVYQLFFLLTGKQAMGYGDFKLLAALGAWLGWQQLLFIVLCASALGSLVGLSLIIFFGRNKNAPMPFGPYLAMAGWLALFFGGSIKMYYFDQILIS